MLLFDYSPSLPTAQRASMATTITAGAINETSSNNLNSPE